MLLDTLVVENSELLWKATEFVLADQNTNKPKKKKREQNKNQETAVLVCLSASAKRRLKRRVLSSSGRCPVCRTGRWTCWWTGSYCCRSWWWYLSRPWGPRHYIAAGGKEKAHHYRKHLLCYSRHGDTELQWEFLSGEQIWIFQFTACLSLGLRWNQSKILFR